MRFLFLLILVPLFLSCNANKSTKFPPFEPFEIDSTSIDFNYSFNDIIHYRDGYLCLADKYEQDDVNLVYLNKDFKIQQDITDKFNRDTTKYIRYIWTSNDSLCMISGLGTYYWSNNQWIYTSSFPPVSKENYASYEKKIPIYEDNDFYVKLVAKGNLAALFILMTKKPGKYTAQKPLVYPISQRSMENIM